MKTLRFLMVIGFLFLIASLCFAAETKRVAVIDEVNGTVEVKLASKSWMPAKVGMVLNQGDSIRTMGNSSAVLDLDGKAETAIIEVKKNSQLSLAELVENKEKNTERTLLDLGLGEVLIKAKKLHTAKSSFEVKTPTSVVGVRGTTFAVSVEAIE